SHELLKGGLCSQKSCTSFGQPDTARCAHEECCADARLKGAHRLTDGRRGHPKLSSRSAETAVLSNAQERLDAVERALPDCEVLLHSPSTLSRLVAHEKRS